MRACVEACLCERTCGFKPYELARATAVCKGLPAVELQLADWARVDELVALARARDELVIALHAHRVPARLQAREEGLPVLERHAVQVRYVFGEADRAVAARVRRLDEAADLKDREQEVGGFEVAALHAHGRVAQPVITADGTGGVEWGGWGCGGQ